jgi:uncharacterized protein (DUF302 family)
MTISRRLAMLALGLALAGPLAAQQPPAASEPAQQQAAPQHPPVPIPPLPFGVSPGMGTVPGTGAMPFMNPMWYPQWFTAFSNPWMNQMTHPGMYGPWMGAFDPRWMGGGQGTGQIEGSGVPPQVPLVRVPGMPTQTLQQLPKNTVSEGIDLENKRRMYQSMMMMSPLSLRDMFTIMADKIPVDEDVSFDDAIDAMKLRANLVNFKLVGHQPMWKEIEATSGEPTPKVEIFQFCDAMVARKILDYAPEFAVFLPCRIALLEDAEGKLWVMTLDWDVGWLDYAQNPNSALDVELRKEAKRIRDALRYIMEGAATGDF